MTMQSEQGMAAVDDSRGQHSHSETCAACSSGQQAPLRTRFSLHSQKAKAGIRSAMRRIIATVNPEPVMRRNTSKRLALKGRMSILPACSWEAGDDLFCVGRILGSPAGSDGFRVRIGAYVGKRGSAGCIFVWQACFAHGDAPGCRVECSRWHGKGHMEPLDSSRSCGLW